MNMLSFIEDINSSYGGPAFSLPSLLRTLDTEFHMKSQILSLTKNGALANNDVIKHFSLPAPILLEQFGTDKLKYSLESRLAFKHAQEVDVIHTNNLWNFFSYLPYNVSQKLNKPNVISVRGSLYPWSLNQSSFIKKSAWYLFQKKALDNAAFIHVTCDDEYKFVKDLGIKSKVIISPHGVDVPTKKHLVSNSFLSKFNLLKENKYFLFMSRLHEKKGLDILLSAWDSIHRLYPDWTLLIAGPDYGNYKDKINSMSECNIKYLGMLVGDEKESCFALSKFFVLPSFSENFGVVIGEAMARSLPVLTTINTPWNCINENNAGACFELNNDELVFNLKNILSLSENERIVMGGNARELIKGKYSWGKVSIPFYDALQSI